MKEITLQELCLHLNELLSPEQFQDYCPNGLQVEGKSTVRTVATAVSASIETIEEAVRRGVDALVVHHGIFWKGGSYTVTGITKKKLSLLLQNEISLIAYHLPLDAHQKYGNNWKAARDLNWRNLTPCLEINGNPIGVYGEFDPISREEFTKTLEDYYQHKAVTVPGGKETVSSVYLVSGGGYKMIHEATKNNVDCFITGSFEEQTWHDAKEGEVNFFGLGHSATERVGPIALNNYLAEKVNIPCEFIDFYNPF